MIDVWRFLTLANLSNLQYLKTVSKDGLKLSAHLFPPLPPTHYYYSPLIFQNSWRQSSNHVSGGTLKPIRYPAVTQYKIVRGVIIHIRTCSYCRTRYILLYLTNILCIRCTLVRRVFHPVNRLWFTGLKSYSSFRCAISLSFHKKSRILINIDCPWMSDAYYFIFSLTSDDLMYFVIKMTKYVICIFHRICRRKIKKCFIVVEYKFWIIRVELSIAIGSVYCFQCFNIIHGTTDCRKVYSSLLGFPHGVVQLSAVFTYIKYNIYLLTCCTIIST